MIYRYTDPKQNYRTVTAESNEPGSYLKSVIPTIQFRDREIIRTFREVTTETGHTLGRAEQKLMAVDGEVWEAHCTFGGREGSMIFPQEGSFFKSWDDACQAILAECDRRERESRAFWNAEVRCENN